MILLALCGTLSQHFPEEFGAEILVEIAKTVQAPSHLTPSITQWKRMLQACAGILSCSDFGQLLHEFLQLCPSFWDQNNNLMDFELTRKSSWPSPKSIADAIQGIGDVSRGNVTEITIVGGGADNCLAGSSCAVGT
jgi:hypothetical protein